MMRRMKLAALMITLVLLSACGGHANEASFERFREKISAAPEIKMTAQVTADYGDSVSDYTLTLTKTAQGSTIEVLAPEIIAGIKANITEDRSSLEYDGLILDTGDLTGDGLTPISALPRLIDAAKLGHVDSVWREGDLIAVKLTPDDVIELTLWLDAETDSPQRAELSSQADGRVLISCDITEFEIR